MTDERFRFAEALLERARRLQRDGFANDKYADVDLDDESYLSKLRTLSLKGPLSLEDLDHVIDAVHRENVERLNRLIKYDKDCNERRDDLHVYYVYNTADKKLIVLAKDAKCARTFACRDGHIREEKNGTVKVLKPEVEAQLRSSGKALGRALRDGYPGVVTELGENVVIAGKSKVYTPMTVIK